MKTDSLTRSDVKEICTAYQNADNQKGMLLALAQRFGVRPSDIVEALESKGYVVETGTTPATATPNKKRRSYPTEVKAAAVKAVIAGASFSASAVDAGADSGSVSNWVIQAAAKEGMQRDEWLDFKRKGIRINPEFEAAVQEMDAAVQEIKLANPTTSTVGASAADPEQLVNNFKQAYQQMQHGLPGCPEWEELERYVDLMRGFAAGLKYATANGWNWLENGGAGG